MWCYRRFGHNEGDEPAFTQPLMYKKIRAHRTTLDIYGEKLVAEGQLSQAEEEKMKENWRAHLEAEMEASQTYKPNKADWLDGRWAGLKPGYEASEDERRGKSGASLEQLKEIGAKLTTPPPDFHLHRTIQRFLENRRNAIDEGQAIDWATAEALAFGTLLSEGHNVRLSGQDVERGGHQFDALGRGGARLRIRLLSRGA
jgi:2-oxoglutarate dehydrogenase E1 component